MACSPELIEYLCGQIPPEYAVRAKKMFGEYGLYCNDQFFAVICDNRFLIKLTQAGKTMLSDGKLELPYEGGSPMLLIEDLEDRQFLRDITLATCAELPPAKSKKKKAAPKA